MRVSEPGLLAGVSDVELARVRVVEGGNRVALYGRCGVANLQSETIGSDLKRWQL